jgi:D-galactarate dehydratase / Altronate hydrolase, C terminus
MRKSAEQQLERRRYEAALAERQFNRVDPDNRLVAAELERRWEAALNEVRAAEDALARAASSQAIAPVAVIKALNDNVIRLSGRLPEIWADPSTTDAKRKALLRCLVEKVVLDRGEHDVAQVRIVWRGGAVSEIDVKMRVGSVARLTRGDEMQQRVIELARTKLHDDEIAGILTCEGHRSPNCADKVLPITVQRIRYRAGLKGLVERRTRWQHAPDLLSAQELAGVLGIPVNWLYVQIRQGRLLIDRHASGAHLFANKPPVIEAVRKLRNHEIEIIELAIAAKGGSTTLNAVYHYAEPVTARGFVYMDTPGYDPVAATGQVAGGCNILCFTTGRGSAYGRKPTPSIKLATNSNVYRRMIDDMDINCGDILDGVLLEAKGQEIFETILQVASGEKSKSEQLGYGDAEYVPWQIGATM